MSDHPRRVIFVNRVYWPSTEATAQLLTDLAEGLAGRGWAVHVIATGHDPAGARNGVTIHRTGPGERHGGLVSRALNFRRFQAAATARLEAMARPGDVVVAMTDPPLLAAVLAPACTARGARLVCWVQDIYPEIAAVHFGPLAAGLGMPLRRRRDAAWLAAAACVTLGEEMQRTLLGRGVAANRIDIVPNWAPRELHRAASPDEIAARRVAWGVGNRFVVAYSGNLGRVHEFATVLEAATRLRAEDRVVFVFIGRGPRFDEVARAARARGLANIRLLPPEPRELLAAALAAADAHLVTLRPEYAPLVYPSKLAGVLAAARPVLFVGPPGGDIANLLHDRGCGEVFAPGAAGELAATIARWQADPAPARAAGARGRAVYEEAWTFASALHRWEERLRVVAGP